MSFLDSNNLEFLAARITQKGRNAIAKGNFKIDYFHFHWGLKNQNKKNSH
jgi:hypothetical protein